MIKKLLIIIAASFLPLTVAGIHADGIINNTDDVGSMYSDHKAYKAGDIVTIIVVETTTGYQSASLKTNKQSGLKAGMGTSSWGGGTTIPFPSVPSWGMAGQEYQDGGGKSMRSGGLTAKISARVEKVLTNGTLSIKGTKVIQINDEKQNLVIKGVIRPEDISSDNTILSTYVAEAQIEYEGNGPVGEKTSPGIITRILDWLGIF